MSTSRGAGTGTPDPQNAEVEPVLAEATVRAIVDAAPDGILVVDERGTILFANQQAEEQFGFVRHELVGRSVEDLLPEQLAQVHRAHRTRYRAEPRLRSMGAGLLLHGRRTDGSEFPVEISLSPLPGERGLRIVAMVRDVTERVNAESRQREVREALDATRDAVLVLDATTLRFTYVNEGAVEQVGYSRDELLGMTMLHITPEFDEQGLRELVAPMVEGESTSIMFTTVHRHRDGTDVPVEILMQAIPGEDGTPLRYVKIVRDIRQRLETEQRLHQAEQHLQLVEDRERIARDLHDVVIQKLFAAGMTVQSVAARSTEPDQGARLHRVVDDLDETIREIRSVIFSLHSDTHQQPGLRASILRIVDEEREALGFEPRIRFDGPVDAVSEYVAAELLPAVREAISNVARHAQATSVDIEVEHRDGLVTLQVADDGVGLPVNPDGGNGIRNLANRAAKLGGRCGVDARPDGGTVLEWQAPDR
ncbi:MAG TPA: PAS domain S-box protein [Acidimicrobiia bacterium]|nr:PAS domain S-box protein [Acidimicrobiia bacterium]